MNYRNILVTLLFSCTAHAFLQEYQGVKAYQQKDFKKAQYDLQQALINNPTDPQILYNNGDVAYRLQDYEAAESYFKKAVKHAQPTTAIREQALFNLGTTYAQQKKLTEALQAFNELLRSNPHHDRAQHNKRVVEELLKEKEKQEQSSESQQKKENTNQKDRQQSQQENDPQHGQDQQGDTQQNDRGKDSQEGQQEQKAGDDKRSGKQQKQKRSEHGTSSQGSTESEQEEQGADDKGTDKQRSKQRQQQQKREELGEQEKAANNDQRSSGQAQKKSQGQNQQDVSQETEKNDRGDSNKQGSHTNLSEAQDKKKTNGVDKKTQQNKEQLVAPAIEQQDSQEEREQPEYQLLKAVDKAEEEIGKDLFKTMVRAKMKGQDGQKNW